MARCRVLFAATIAVIMIFNEADGYSSSLYKKGNIDVFNLLLGLYKLNPLKSSKVYKTFADKVLNGSEKISTISYDSNESKMNPRIQQLNEIERLIHVRKAKAHHSYMGKPEYDIENVDTEHFNANLVVQEKMANQYQGNTINVHRNELDNPSDIYDPLESNQIKYDNFMISSLPIHDAITVKSINHYQLIPTQTKLSYDEKARNQFDGINNGPVMQVQNYIQDVPAISDNVMTADVIVL